MGSCDCLPTLKHYTQILASVKDRPNPLRHCPYQSDAKHVRAHVRLYIRTGPGSGECLLYTTHTFLTYWVSTRVQDNCAVVSVAAAAGHLRELRVRAEPAVLVLLLLRGEQAPPAVGLVGHQPPVPESSHYF